MDVFLRGCGVVFVFLVGVVALAVAWAWVADTLAAIRSYNASRRLERENERLRTEIRLKDDRIHFLETAASIALRGS